MPLKDPLNRLREQDQQGKQDRSALIAGWEGAVDALLIPAAGEVDSRS